MTAFLGAMPQSPSDSFTRFHVSAAATPSVMARIIGLFAKLMLMPDVFHAERAGEGAVEIEVRIGGLTPEQVDHVARALRQIIEVDQVLVALEEPVAALTRARA